MSSIAIEEFELLGDPKYRSYMTQVDRCLRGFESTTEWADLIAALTKLNKVLLAHMKYPIIPRRIIISKRLAQCMHPALPAGVHQKALETYDIIFKCMGTNRLAAELFIYSAGLFPLLSNAAMNVRSILLTVYENHFVPLGDRLRPGLNGFLSGVLPGLEEGSDHYQRTNNLLEAVAEAVQPQVFYSGLWECVATNATIRLPALTFVLCHCGKKTRGLSAASTQPYLLGADHDVMCRALCLALQDSSALVQRSALDLLLQGFPLHHPQFVKQDMVCLVSSVLSSLLRRDMSLNRRLFSWILGSEINPDLLPGSHPAVQRTGSEEIEEEVKEETYFSRYGRDLVVSAVLRILEESIPNRATDQPLDTKPFRIITSLLDKPEIGPFIVDHIILDIFRTLYHMSDKKAEKGNIRQDLIKTANLLFSQLDTSFVWSVCSKHFDIACQSAEGNPPNLDIMVLGVGEGETNIREMCFIIDFLLEIVSIETYIETSSEHLPKLFQSMVQSVRRSINWLAGSDLNECLSSCKRVLGRVQPAWNVWDLNESLRGRTSSELDKSDLSDEVLEATESTTATPIKTNETNNNRSSGQHKASSLHDQLIKKCNQSYTEMFLEFLEFRILETPLQDWKDMVESSNIVLQDQNEDLSNMLNSLMSGGTLERTGRESEPKSSVSLRPGSELLTDAFSSACTGLVELSSMPKYNKVDAEDAKGVLPAWLEALLLCATMQNVNESKISESNIRIQLTAVATLIELTSVLSTCVAAVSRPRSADNVESVLVTMDPLLTTEHLNIICWKTDTIRLIATSLWNSLGLVPSVYHLQCVTLLHRLLELAPQASVVENVVAESLQASISGSSVNVFRRFSQLWHLSRDISGSRKTLDLCLNKMVSGLRSEKSAVRTLCERWVEHSLSRGDTGRLLEPLLLSLLDPASARLSVLHANIKESRAASKPTPQSSPRLPRVFAISSLENNVIYHITNSKPECPLPRSKVQCLTAGSEGRTTLTDMSLLNPETLTRFPYAKMSMWVNPFALVSSESEFNKDPSGTPEPAEETRPSSPTLSEPYSFSSESGAGTPRKGSNTHLSSDHESQSVVAFILDLILEKVVSEDQFLLKLDDLQFPEPSNHTRHSGMNPVDSSEGGVVTVHPLHSHLLMYCKCIDSRAVLHTLQALSSILSIHPRLAVSSLATTGVASPSLSRSVQLVQLMARHKRSIFGKGFSSPLPSDSTSQYRSSMLVEVVLTICLYYLRSYYPGIPGLTREEVLGNREVQLTAVSLLNKITSELILIVKDNGKPFALFVSDLFHRTKLQKVILHSLLSGVHSVPSPELSFTIDIIRFNDDDTDQDSGISVNTEAFQVEILKLVLSLVMLEEIIYQKKYEDTDRPRLPYIDSTVMKYTPEYPFSEQPMFLAAILSALRQHQLRDLHHHWSGLVISCLPFLGTALTQVVTSVSAQIWSNLENLANLATNRDIYQSVPSDYVLTQLEALGQILSYCLLEGGQGGLSSGPQPNLSASHQNSIVANLVHVFGGPVNPSRQPASKEQLLSARRSLLSMTPRLVLALIALWNSVSKTSDQKNTNWLVGSSKAVKNMILDLLSPIATIHPTYLLSAVAVAWAEKGISLDLNRKVLVELITSLRMFPTSTVLSTMRLVLKSPPPVSGKGTLSLEVSSLQFLSSYLSSTSPTTLAESWNSLKDLLKDCLSLAPPSVFLALEILHQVVVSGVAANLEKRDSRELQEMAGKLIECVSGIAGSRLEAGTWLRGIRTVRTDIQDEGRDDATKYAAQALSILGQHMATILDIIFQSEEKEKVLPLLTGVMYNTVPYLRNHSKVGMSMLRGGAQVLASVSEYPYTRKSWRKEGMELLLDPAFFQMDHESLRFWKTTTDNLMTHDKITFKELLSRIASLGQSNISLFSSKEQEQEQRALLLKRLAFVIFCSDVDQYQKQMPDITDRLSECLRTVPVSPAVQAAVFLCFRVILLRMSAVHVTFLWPVIITEMVLVFSYIEQELLSESPQFSSHLKRVSTMDSSWVAAAAPGLQAHNSPAWLGVYLAVCKLLDQAVALPASLLPQFQMYRWAFVREGSCPQSQLQNGHSDSNSQHGSPREHGNSSSSDGGSPSSHGGTSLHVQDFVPHIARIAKLIETKVGREIHPRPVVAGEPLLTTKYIDSLVDLGPWFSTLSYSLTRQQTKSVHANSKQRSPVGILERIIELDFLEPIPGS